MRRIIVIFITFAVLSSAITVMPAAVYEPTQLVPVGIAVGLELQTDGVYVAAFSCEDSAAEQAGIREGDRIVSVNGVCVTTAPSLRKALEHCTDAELILRVKRRGEDMSFTVTPQRRNGTAWLGVFVRDKITGIGTVTFYDPQTKLFGALGHGVNDPASSAPLPLLQGSASKTRIVDVIPGEKGKPGALCGSASDGPPLGALSRNTTCGIFGHFDETAWDLTPLPLADPGDVKPGPAEIRCSVSGDQPESYRIAIEKVRSEAEDGRQLLLRVTDERLLQTTGGIVQGMSGSPIIQNGRLVGAVTHVLVQEPTKGYGILIGSMLEASGAYEQKQQAA